MPKHKKAVKTHAVHFARINHQTTTDKNKAPRGNLAKALYIKNKEEGPSLKAVKRMGKHPAGHRRGTQSIGASCQ